MFLRRLGLRLAQRRSNRKQTNPSNSRSLSKRVNQSRLDSTREPQRIELSVPESNTSISALIVSAVSCIVESRATSVGLDPAVYGRHSMRRTKASLVYRRTMNLRAVQLLSAHTKLESAVRYLGIEVDDALELAEQPEV
jgi:hypothetical protein